MILRGRGKSHKLTDDDKSFSLEALRKYFSVQLILSASSLLIMYTVKLCDIHNSMERYVIYKVRQNAFKCGYAVNAMPHWEINGMLFYWSLPVKNNCYTKYS